MTGGFLKRLKNQNKKSKKPIFDIGKFFVGKKEAGKGFLRLDMFVLVLMQFLYNVHLKIRYGHDIAYKKIKWYKNYSDSPISKNIHKASTYAFIASFFVFYTMQYLAPFLMNPLKPNEAYAGTDGITWESLTDFSGGTPAVQNDGNLNISGTGNAATFQLGNNPAVNTGTGTDGKLVVDGASATIDKPEGGAIEYTRSIGTHPALFPNGFYSIDLDPALDDSPGVDDNKYNFSSVELKNSGVITHSLGSTGSGGVQGIEIYTTGTFSVSANSKIDVSGKGDSALGKSAAGTYRGGSYGGRGGQGWSSGALTGLAPAPYGTQEGVEYFGSPGSNAGGAGAYGGGRVKVVANSLVANGSIQANGISTNNSGGGSGGGIYLAAATMTINSYVSAAGAGGSSNVGLGTNGNNGTGGAGGGPNLGGAPGFTGNGGNAGYNGNPGGASAGGGASGGNNLAGGGGGAGRIAIYYGSLNGGAALVNQNVQETAAGLTKVGTWNTDGLHPETPLSGYIATPATYSANTTLSYTFSGADSLKWYGAKLYNGGIAEISFGEQGQTPTVTTKDTFSAATYLDCDETEVDCGLPEEWWTVYPIEPSVLYTSPALDSTKTYTITIKQLNQKNPGGGADGGYKIAFDRFEVSGTNLVGATNTFTGVSPAVGVIGPYGYFSKITPYVPSGILGGANTASGKVGLRGNPGKRVKWNSIRLIGTIPAGTTVKFMAKTYDANFRAPDTKTIDSWSASIASGTWTDQSPGVLDISSQNLVSGSIELYVQLTGGAATPVIDKVIAAYDFLDAPTNLKHHDGYNEISNNGFTNQTTLTLKGDISAMDNIPNEDLTPEIELVTPSSGAFQNPASGSAVPAGVTFTPQTNSHTANTPAPQATLGTITGLGANASYKWQIRFTDAAGRVGNWSTPVIFTTDQTPPTLTSISVNSGAQYTNSNAVSIALTGAADASSGLSQMRFSNDGSSWSDWEAYSATKTGWDLKSYPTNTSDGARTVYAQVKDNAGNTSGQILDSTFDINPQGARASVNVTDGRLSLNGTETTLGVYHSVASARGDGLVTGMDGAPTSASFSDNGITILNIDSGEVHDETIGFFKFNNNLLAGLQSANLRLNIASGSGTIESVGDFGDINTTDYTLPTLGNKSFTSSGGTVYFDVKSLVAADIAAGRGVSGFRLKANLGESITVSTTENADDNLRPKLILASLPFATSGTFTSRIIDGGNAAPLYGKFLPSAMIPTNSSVAYQLRTGNNATTIDGSWGAWTDVTSGSVVPGSLGGANKRYFQYKAVLANTVNTVTPIIDDVFIELVGNIADSIVLDATAPTGSIQIKANANYANSSRAANNPLTISANDGTGTGLAYMQFSNDGANWGVTNSATAGTISDTAGNCTSPKSWDGTTCWVPYATSYSSWNLTKGAYNSGVAEGGSDGVRTTYVKFRDNAGNIAGSVMAPDNTWYASTNNTLQYTEPISLSYVTWTAASNGCSALGGRLPTLAELQDPVNIVPVIYSDLYWTSSVNGLSAILYNGEDGGEGSDVITGLHPTVCVRNVVDNSIKDDITLDTTAPAAPATVSDGIGADEAYAKSISQLSANWSGSTDTLAGLQKYQYAIGTTIGGTNIVDWSDNSTNTNVTKTGLSLNSGQTYYFSVRAVDNASNVGTARNSNGIYFDAELPSGTILIDSGASATVDLDVNVTFTLSDAFSGLDKYRIYNGTAWSDFTNITGVSYNSPSPVVVNIPNTDQGNKEIRIEVYDKAGNAVSNISDTIAYDSIPPSSINPVIARNGSDLTEILSENGVSQGWYRYNNPNFLIRAVDEQSGIKEFKYCFVKSSETCDFSANTPIPAVQVGSSTTYEGNITITLADIRQGVLGLRIKGVDFVGLESAESAYSYKFDKTLPGAILGFSASKGTELTTVKLMWDDPFTNATPQAPTQKFKVERIKADDYTPSLGYDGTWTDVASYNQQILDVVTDAAVLVKVGNVYTFYDQTMQNSLKYLYRVSAKDYSNSSPNDGFGALPVDDPEFVESGYGFTRDTAAPEIYPSSVIATPCNSNSNGGVCSGINKKGHQVQVKWLPAFDSGAGVKGYEVYRRVGGSAEPSGWEKIESNFAETLDPLDSYRIYYDNTVTDAKSYSYRIVAFDDIAAELGVPNKTDLFRGNDYTNVDNATTSTANVPDVTPPAVPSTFNVSAVGIDYIADENGDFHQKVTSTWKQTTDNSLLTNITYQLYFSATNTPESFVVVDTKNSLPFDPLTQLEANRTSYKFDQTGFPDKTTFYYYLKVTDSLGNTASSTTRSVTTGNSQAPTKPTGVEVHNDITGMTDPGTQLTVKFRGSLAKNCDEVTKADCIVEYQTYRSRSNIVPDKDGTLTEDTSDNCNLDESVDDCWIRLNSATLANTQIPNPPVANETLIAKRSFLAEGLTQATKYYFRVRAIDNNTDEPLKSALSDIDENETHLGGWDITRDLTAPALPAGGLEVKVKDTHPNTTVLRNLVSWKILESEPLRKKQSYEECTAVVVNGVDYCNDFGRYEIYRQILDTNNNIIFDPETPIATITDPETNFYIDSIESNEVLEGVGSEPKIIDTKIRYYVQVVDNAFDVFRYPDDSKINTAPNKTDKQYSDDTIIPSKATPSVVGAVALSQVGVTSAVVSWNTDQDTDSLVQYRVNGSGTDWVTVGQVERRATHSVKVFGLLPNTTYEYKLVSRNYLDNRATYEQSALPMLKTGGFNVLDDSIAVVTTTTGVDISWKTNLEAASSFVEYQMQTQPGDEPQGKTVGVNPEDIAAQPRDHKVIFNGLKSSRTYTYKIKSISKDGFVAETGFRTFSTKSFDTSQFTITPSSSNVAEKNITSTTALIAWSTGVPTTSWVDYSPNRITKENKLISSAGNNDLNTQHAVQLEGLVPGTKYYYVVRSKNANDVEFTSPEYSFTAVLKPKISDFKIIEIKPYQIAVSWTTNVDTETIVNWGKTAAYGEKRGKNEQTKNHMLVIDQLEDNTEYHMQIVAHDETGTEVVDADKIIRTPLDTNGPKIENVKTDILPMGASDESGSVVISWNTDKPATTMVEYDEGIISGRYGMRSIEDKTLNLSHTVIIKELKPSSSYHYRIVTIDKRGNKTISQDFTFVTPSKEKSILQLIIKSLEETFAWTRNMNLFFGNIGKRIRGK